MVWIWWLRLCVTGKMVMCLKLFFYFYFISIILIIGGTAGSVSTSCPWCPCAVYPVLLVSVRVYSGQTLCLIRTVIIIYCI